MTAAEAGSRWNVRPMYLDSMTYPDWHPRFGEVGPVYAYLVGDDERLILVDTGLGPEQPIIDRLYRPTRTDLAAALARDHGITVEDIDAVVVSHLHFDHIGGAQAFRSTPIYVQRPEWEAAQEPKYTIPEFLSFPDANFVLLDGDVELAPGFRVVATPGHTPGHQVVAISTPNGIVVLAGQAVETLSELEEMLATGTLRDDARKVMGLEPVKVWFSHDHRVWERPHAAHR